MTAIGWHFQSGVPGWASGLVNAEYNKIMDPGTADPLQGRKTIGRVYVEDHISNEWIMRGDVAAWLALCEPYYQRAEWVHAWEGPNEPPVETLQQRQALTAFTVAWAKRMRQRGRRTVGLNISVGRPDIGVAGDLGPALQYLDYVGLHEYGAPSMQHGQSWYCLRYRRTVAEWQAAGFTVPKIIIGECGIDGGVLGPETAKQGWQRFASEQEYAAQLDWYAGEISKDPLVVGAVAFTATPAGWASFDVTESLSRRIAADNAKRTAPVAPPPVVQPPTEIVRPRLRWPLANVHITQEFGVNGANYARFGLIGHNGIDLRAATGTPVFAPHSGQAWVYTDTDYGQVVEVWYPRIEQGARYKTIVAHGSRQLVTHGRMVEAGQDIMLAGSTGNSTGPHVHFSFKPLRGPGGMKPRNPGYLDWVDPRFFTE